MSLIKNGEKKVLIPAFRDMDPYDLPVEFAHLQAQDMSKLGFMQDLIRGISKIIGSQSQQKTVKETVILKGEGNAEALLKRGSLALEEGRWDEADGYFERVLDMDAENALAYLGKLMAELHIHAKAELADQAEPFDDNQNYARVLRFADVGLKDQLEEYNRNIRYRRAEHVMQSAFGEAEYKEAAFLFGQIAGYKDAEEQQQKCLKQAKEIANRKIYLQATAGYIKKYDDIAALTIAVRKLASIPGYRDADEIKEEYEKQIRRLELEHEKQEQQRKEHLQQIMEEQRIRREKRKKRVTKIALFTLLFVCLSAGLLTLVNRVILPENRYQTAKSMLEEKKYGEAADMFESLGDYKDAAVQFVSASYSEAEQLQSAGKSLEAAIAFGKAGTYLDARERSLSLWNASLQRRTLSIGIYHAVAVKTDGTVVAARFGDELYHGQCDISDFKDIVEVAAGRYHSIGLRSDGTVVATNYIPNSYYNSYNGQCDVSDWKDIAEIAAGDDYSAGLKMDGTVVTTDSTYMVSDWKDIIAIAADFSHIVGLKADGTVVAAGKNEYGQCNTSDWKDIVAIAAGASCTVGLRSDGTVVAIGENSDGRCNTEEWSDITAIGAGCSSFTFGIKTDGTVVATEYTGEQRFYYDEDHVSHWKDIVAVAPGYEYTLGLRSDGRVVCAGRNVENWEPNVSGWQDIALPNRAGR